MLCGVDRVDRQGGAILFRREAGNDACSEDGGYERGSHGRNLAPGSSTRRHRLYVDPARLSSMDRTRQSRKRTILL